MRVTGDLSVIYFMVYRLGTFSIISDTHESLCRAIATILANKQGVFTFPCYDVHSERVGPASIVLCQLASSLFVRNDVGDSLSNPKRERHAGQRQIMGTKTCSVNGTALGVILREACVC